MSFVKSPRFWHHLAFRLSLWYGGVLVLAVLACFSAFYGLMVSSMQARADAELTHYAQVLSDSLKREGLAGLQAQMHEEATAIGVDDVFFRALDGQGRQVGSSDLASWGDLSLQGDPNTFGSASAPAFAYGHGQGHHGTVRLLTTPLGNELTLEAGLSVQDDQQVIESLRRTTSMIAGATTVLAVLMGWLMARRALAGMHGVTQTARRISEGASLDSRVPVTGSGDEVDQLAQTVNGMLDRIRGLVQNIKQTNDHLAHELRSPVTRIRGAAEITLLGQSSTTDYQAMAASTVEECDRLLALINALLDIAELEGRVPGRPMAHVDMAQMAHDVCELFEPVAEDKGIRLSGRSVGPCLVEGNAQWLQRVLANLLDNAIKYSPAEGSVEVEAAAHTDEITITVRNSGPGIGADELPRVFERFFRGRHGRAQPGHGLGLSLARAVVEAHGGQLSVESRENVATTFTVTLPACGNPGRHAGPPR